MTSIKTFAWSGIAVAIAAFLALATLATTVQAAAPTTVNVIIDEGNTAIGGDSANDDDSIASNADNAQAVQIVVDVDDADDRSDQTVVTITTTIGTFTNGTTTIQVLCGLATPAAITGLTVDDDDTGVDSGTIVGITEGSFTGAAEAGADVDGEVDGDNDSQGCAGVAETLILPAGVAPGTYQVTATTTNGIADVDNLVVTAAVGTTASAINHVSQSHDAVGYTAAGSYTPWINGSLWTVRVVDSNGNGVNGRQVSFTTDNGKLAADPGAPTETTINGTQCNATTNLGKQVIGTTATIGTSSTNTGRARVILCGDSASAGKTAKLTATVSGTSFSVTDEVTISAEPTANDIVVTVSGSTINVSVMPGGVPAPDDTVVLFAPVPNDSAAVANACVELHDGKASTAVAVAGGTVAQVLVSLENRNDTDADNAQCDEAQQEAWGSVSALVGSPTPTVVPTGTATGTATPSGPGTISGDKPPASGGGIGLFVFNGGTVQQLVTASGCNPATASFYVTSGGVFLTYVPGTTITAVNADFLAKFPGGNIPANTPMMGKCS